jgi:MAE_28990/MAE_18760-like HEPN
MSTWEQQIEKDLAWRESEMGTLKLLLASSTTGSDRQRALLRACSAMLYAHYEGFCKFCWTLMLDIITANSHVRRDLVEPLARRTMTRVFKAVRTNTSDANLWKFSSTDFQRELSQVAPFPDEIDTESNLWPRLAQEINTSGGLKCPLFETHSWSWVN